MQSDIFLTNRLKNENKKVISPDSIDDSYNIQNYIIKNINKKVGAWKIGGSSLATQQLFKTNKVYYGPVFKDFIYKLKTNQVKPDFIKNSYNAEIELVFNVEKAENSNFNFSGWRIKKIFIGIESPFTKYQINDNLNLLVADLCASGMILIGNELDFKDLDKFKNEEITLSSDNKILTSAYIESLKSSQIEILKQSLSIIKKNLSNCNSTLISTGGISKCVKLCLNRIYYLKFSNKIIPFSMVD